MPVSQYHEFRVATLDMIARLAGFDEELKQLPDGGRPDVLRASALSGNIFMGDAKETERPWDQPLRRRLSRYMWWFRRNATIHGRGSLFALCVSGDVDACDWALLLDELAREAGLPAIDVKARALGSDTVVVWLRLRSSRTLARTSCTPVTDTDPRDGHPGSSINGLNDPRLQPSAV